MPPRKTATTASKSRRTSVSNKAFDEARAAQKAKELAEKKAREAAADRSVLKAAAYFTEMESCGSFTQVLEPFGLDYSATQAALARLTKRELLRDNDEYWYTHYGLSRKGLIKAVELLVADEGDEATKKLKERFAESEDATELDRRHYETLEALIAIFKGEAPANKAVSTVSGWERYGRFRGAWYSETAETDERFRKLLEWLPDVFFSSFFDYVCDNFQSTSDLGLKPFAIDYLRERLTADDNAVDWLLYHADFLKKGNPEACAARVRGGTVSGELMLGVAALYRNEPPKTALDHIKKALSLAGRKRLFENFTEDWFYLVALYRDRENPQSLKKLKQLAETKKIAENEATYWLWLLAAEGCMLDYKRRANACMRELLSSYDEAASYGLFYVLADRVGIEFEFSWHRDKQIAALREAGLPFAVELYRFQTTDASKKTLQDAAQAGIAPLLPDYEEKAVWETVLDRLLAEESLLDTEVKRTKNASQGSGPSARIVYQLDVPKNDIQVIVQKTRNGVNWSKGSAITLPTFAKGVDGMTTQDKAVASAVRKSPHWNRYVLSWYPAMEALIGSPTVFDATTGAHLEVVSEPLRITVRHDKAGYCFETNLASDFNVGDKLSVSLPQNGRVVVVKPTEKEQSLLKTLHQVNHFPEKSVPKLTAYLEKLSKRTPVMSELLKNSTTLKKVKGDARITFRIQPLEEGFYSVEALVHPLSASSLACEPGEGLAYLAANSAEGTVQVERDLEAEKKNFVAIEAAIAALDDRREERFVWRLDLRGTLTLLEAVREAESLALVEWPEGEKFFVQKAKLSADALKLSLSRVGSWFEVEGKVRLDKKTYLSIAELLEKIRSEESGFIRLSDTEYVALTESLRKQLALLDGFAGKGKRGAVKVSVFNANLIEGLEDAGVEVDADEAYRAFEKRMREARDYFPSIPKGLRAELRSYQQEGYEWLARLAHWGAGALLADDMGLGKTIQAIALLLERAQMGAALVVAPASVLFNWVDELKRFAPSLKPIVFNQADRDQVVSAVGAGDVVLVTYGVLSQEIDKLASREWASLVLDEAHTIKNRETKMSKAAKQLKSDARVLLTGTPIQNHLSEIWNLFDVANPGLLGGFDAFGERFIVPVERDHNREQQRLLKRLISPFILRRTKAEVLEELPQKTDITIRVELSEKERALYENLRESASINLESGVINSIEALAELTKLRQAACHPALVNPKLKIESSKTKAFLSLVDDLQEGGHRALVFSQFTSHLALIRKALDEKGVPYLYLDGAVPAGERKKLADEFQKSEVPLFLISLKAGGTGLNLTDADFVIHLDPWWNPAIEDQASDRAYRIGQEKPVTIYRLVSENTIEEKILRLHETKKSLADALLEGSDVSSRFSRDEILKLLAAG